MEDTPLKTVRLPIDPPRDLEAISRAIPLTQGLRVGRTFGVAFMTAGLLCPFLAVLAPLPDTGVRLFLGIFGTLGAIAFGALFFVPEQRRLKARLRAFGDGQLAQATVTAHGRAFVPWKSWRDYTLAITATSEGEGKRTCTLQTPGDELQKAFPVGSSIQVLHDPNTNALFCPAELGIEIVSE